MEKSAKQESYEARIESLELDLKYASEAIQHNRRDTRTNIQLISAYQDGYNHGARDASMIASEADSEIAFLRAVIGKNRNYWECKKSEHDGLWHVFYANNDGDILEEPICKTSDEDDARQIARGLNMVMREDDK